MKTSFVDTIIDFSLDILDYYEKNKKFSQTLLASLLLGSSFGFASAAFVPEVPESDLMLASIIDAQEEAKVQELLKQAAEAEALHASAIDESQLQDIYARVVLEKNPELCTTELTGAQATSCMDNYWNLQASLEGSVALCEQIQNETLKASCNQKTVATVEGETTGKKVISSAEIESKSLECLSFPNQANQNTCWNSLFLSVAINNADISKCDNIKDNALKSTCEEKTELTIDKNVKEEAVTQKSTEMCEEINDSAVKYSCVQEVSKAILTVTDTCNETCVNKKAKEMAVMQKNTTTCSFATTETAKEECRTAVYTQKAKDASDSSICDNIADEKLYKSCIAGVPEKEDKNPDVQKEVFKKSDREVPSIGQELIDPMTEFSKTFGEDEDVSNDADFNAVLEALTGSSSISSGSSFSAIYTDVCEIYSDEKQRMACEDSIILQSAIPNKDLEKCSFIQEEETREFCELEIVQADAIQAAELAKQRCNALSSASVQQKCLMNAGFYSNVEVENSADCLDYSDPLDRIACMREVGGTSDSTTTVEVDSSDDFSDFSEGDEDLIEIQE